MGCFIFFLVGWLLFFVCLPLIFSNSILLVSLLLKSLKNVNSLYFWSVNHVSVCPGCACKVVVFFVLFCFNFLCAVCVILFVWLCTEKKTLHCCITRLKLSFQKITSTYFNFTYVLWFLNTGKLIV